MFATCDRCYQIYVIKNTLSLAVLQKYNRWENFVKVSHLVFRLSLIVFNYFVQISWPSHFTPLILQWLNVYQTIQRKTHANVSKNQNYSSATLPAKTKFFGEHHRNSYKITPRFVAFTQSFLLKLIDRVNAP